MPNFQSRHYWTPRRHKRWQRHFDRLSPKERGALIDSEAGWPERRNDSRRDYAREALSKEELTALRVAPGVWPGTCWNCGKAPRGLCACLRCGAELPVGSWWFPPIQWPEFSADDPVLAVGTVGFRYGEHFLRCEFAVAEPDAERRKALAAMMARDAVAKREANREFLWRALDALVAEWRARFGHYKLN